MERVFLTPAQLSDRWQIKPQTLALWRMRRQKPEFIKIGHQVRYAIDSVEKFEKQEVC